MPEPDKPRWARSWHCMIHGQVGDINGPVHYELCPISGSLIREANRAALCGSTVDLGEDSYQQHGIGGLHLP